ncbi:MAG: hypothetical protein AABZ39_11805 [Spirochaetota bacterium]
MKFSVLIAIGAVLYAASAHDLYGQTNAPAKASREAASGITNARTAGSDYDSRGKSLTAISGFRTIRLGQTMKQAIDAIYEDNLMILPSKFVERDIDIIGEKSDTFVNLAENKYFKSGYFLFKGDRLFSIRLAFQEKQFTFLDLMNALTAKYGQGRYRDNNTVVWEESGREIALERPSTVKYFERTVLSNTAADFRKSRDNASGDRDSLLKGL